MPSVVSRAMKRAIPQRLEVVVKGVSQTNVGTTAVRYDAAKIQSCWLKQGHQIVARARLVKIYEDKLDIIVEEVMRESKQAGPVPVREVAERQGMGLSPVEMEVGISLGAVELSVDELMALRPGTQLQIGLPVGAKMLIQLNNTTWATGEISDIDARTGNATLKISEVFPFNRKLSQENCDVGNEGNATRVA